MDARRDELDRPAVETPAEATTEIAALPEVARDRYRIEARLGVGGMGEVFRARDLRLGRSVAIKTSSERFASRFEVEARAISALNHPHICTLYDVGADYLVMELVEGETLAARLRRGPLPLLETLRTAAEIAEALAEAHAHQIVHRDLKPANIMLTRHGVKVLDFGLARMLTDAKVTASHVVMGTPGYMAPEQVEGRDATAATDLFALGLVIYEMATGALPFPGASLGRMLSAGPTGPVSLGAGPTSACARELEGLIRQLLASDPAARPQSAADVAQRLTALADRLEAPPAVSRWRPAIAVAVLLLVVTSSAGWWLYRGVQQRRWAREVALPQATTIAADEPLAAYLLLRQVEGILPGDPQVAELVQSTTRLISIQTTPAGGAVAIQDYRTPGAWFSLGTAPRAGVRVPRGYFRWKVSAAGHADLISAPPVVDVMRFDLTAADGNSTRMAVPAGTSGEFVDFVGWVTGTLPAFTIDKYEVTNAQYQAFVDHGGYSNPTYWKERFVKDGRELTWQQAMDLLRDPTGRPGPSTWEAGHFPEGKGNYPVTGVSWYEAAAYAAYSGASLPVILQWFKAAPPDLAPNLAVVSNFGGSGTAPVGRFAGVGPYGTYDMAGNAREWSATASADLRVILGGAFGTHSYRTSDLDLLPPWDRSPMNGFRTVRSAAPLPASATGPLPVHGRDFAKAKPVSDAVFEAYKAMYAYERHPLDATPAVVVDDTPDWTKQKVTIDAGYEGQRLTVFLFLPKHVPPPFQTVLFFPSARVEFATDSRNLIDLQFVDYVIKSGRALAYPIYNGTYERVRRTGTTRQTDDLPITVQRYKEVGRSIDYLVTRPDVDSTRIGYLGVSMGAAFGTIFTALETRFRAIVFLDGGFFLEPPQPGWDQVDFAPRVTKPVLMVNGRYDFSFSPARSAEPLFRALGTPPADKRQVFLDTPHDVSQEKDQLSKEVLAWFDKYLGRVR